MLTAQRKSDQIKVMAHLSEKTEAPFICGACGKEVVLNKGNIKAHYFRHKPPVTCYRGRGETEAHMACKKAIYDSLVGVTNVTQLEMEKDFGISIADVFAVISNQPVAIEIQRSALSVQEITRRTENYERLGVHVLWIALSRPEIFESKISPNAWEKWTHAAYMGRVYYWVGEGRLLPVHFSVYRTHVEFKSWFETGGVERTVGGYDRATKRYRTPERGKEVNVAYNFKAIQKAAYAKGSVVVPKCRLYIDSQKTWWKSS